MSHSGAQKSPSKRAASEPIIGYIHNLSPVKRNRTKTMDYVSLTLQTSEEETREALLYSPKKRPLFSQREESRTAIKLQNYAYTEDGKKLVVNDMTYISTPNPTEYKFQYAAELPTAEVSQKPVSILDILNAHKEWDTMAVQGKVVHMKEPTIVGSRKLRLCEAVLADTTASIPLDIWNEQINNITLGCVYHISPVQVRVWNNNKKLSTIFEKTKATAINDEQLEALPEIHQDEQEPETTVIVKEFLAIPFFEKFLKCKTCQKKIQQENSSKIVKCVRCGMLRADRCGYGLSVRIKVKLAETEDQITLKLGDEVLSKLVGSDSLTIEEDDVVESLLFLENVKLTYSTDTFVITKVHV